METSPHIEGFHQLVENPKEWLARIDGFSVGGFSLRLTSARVDKPALLEEDVRDKCLGDWVGWVTAAVEVVEGPVVGRGTRTSSSHEIRFSVPWMTKRGTFFRNGTEYVPLVQLIPLPGVTFRSSISQSGFHRTIRADIYPERGELLHMWARVRPQASERKFHVGKSFKVDEIPKPYLGPEGRMRLDQRVAAILGNVPVTEDLHPHLRRRSEY